MKMKDIEVGMEVEIIKGGLLFEDLAIGSIVTVFKVLPDNILVEGNSGNKYKLKLEHLESVTKETLRCGESSEYKQALKKTSEITLERPITFGNIEKQTPQEYITVPNSDKKFLKPEFECEILKEMFLEEMFYYVGYVKLYRGMGFIPYTCYWDEKGICNMILPDLNSYEDISADCQEDYNLTPYEEPKPWYEIESNFPCLVTLKDKKAQLHLVNNYQYTKENETHWVSFTQHGIDAYSLNLEHYRLATNEEIDSLKVKEV